MNHCYKVIFNRSLGVWQAVTELAKSHGKSGGERAKAASSGAARRRAAVSGLLLSAAGIGLFGATDALARCYNKTSLDNGRGNQSPLIRTAAQVSGGANIGTYQPVSNDVIICDQDTTPVPAQPNTLLNPLNATTQIFAASGVPGTLNGIPGYRPTENVTVHLTDGFTTSNLAVLSFINVSYAATVTIDEGATIHIAQGTTGYTWAVGLMHGGSASTIVNNGLIETSGRNSVGISIGPVGMIATETVNSYVTNNGLVIPSADNVVVNNGSINTGANCSSSNNCGINASGINAVNSARLSITNTGSITVNGPTRPDALNGANLAAKMAAGIYIGNTPPFAGPKPSAPPATTVPGSPAPGIPATSDIFKNPINPALYDLNPSGISSGTILNTGTISANQGSGIEVRASDITIVNRGVFEDTDSDPDTPDELVSKGVIESTLSAAVHFSKNDYGLAEGNNTLILQPGSELNGDVVSASAGNILRLQGSGTEESHLGAGTLMVSNGATSNTQSEYDYPITGMGLGQLTMGELSGAEITYAESPPLPAWPDTLPSLSGFQPPERTQIPVDITTEKTDKWVLTGVVSISGTAADAVLVKTGTLQIGDGGTTGILRTPDDIFPGSGQPDRGSANVKIDTDGTLVFNRSDTLTHAGVISGTGNFEQVGVGGRLILTGENSYTGKTTIGLGSTLQIGNLGDDTYTVDLGPDGVRGSWVGAGADGVVGPAGTSGGADDVYSLLGTGDDDVQPDIGDGLTGSIPLSETISNSGVLEFKRAGDPVFVTGVIEGTGKLNQFGSARVILTGENIYTGGTEIANGSILQIGDYGVVSPADDGPDGIPGTLDDIPEHVGTGASGSILYSNILDNGELAFNRAGDTVVGGVISGGGLVTQNGPGTTTLNGANTYGGGTFINLGTLAVADNSTSSLDNLGTGKVFIDTPGTLLIPTTDSFLFESDLTGTGTVRVDMASPTNTFDFSEDAGAFAGDAGGFTGTLDMHTGTYWLADYQDTPTTRYNNVTALKDATLKASAGSTIMVGPPIISPETEVIKGLTIDGGTLIFDDHVLSQDVATAHIATTGTLDLTGTGTIRADVGDYVNDPPPAVPAPTIPGRGLLQQDDTEALSLLIEARGPVLGSGGGLTLEDRTTGDLVTNKQHVNIEQTVGASEIKVAEGIYDYGLVAVAGGEVYKSGDPVERLDQSADGLYVGYSLTEVQLIGKDADGEALVLRPSGSGLSSDLGAKLTDYKDRITGDFITAGDLVIEAQGSDVYSDLTTVSLSNPLNDYTGQTHVKSGTLRLDANKALGNTSLLKLDAGTTTDINGKTQTIGEFQGADANTALSQPKSELNLNGGTLTIKNGGFSDGTLKGAGELILAEDAADFKVHGANDELTANVTIESGASATLDDVAGLGNNANGAIEVKADGDLNFEGATATGNLSKTITGAGNVNLADGANVTLNNTANTFSGVWNIDADSVLTAKALGHLGTAAIVDEGELHIDTINSWQINNDISGAGDVYKEGSGLLLIAGDLTYSGTTYVKAGTFAAGEVDAFSPDSAVDVSAGATLHANGFDQTIAGLSNDGIVDIANNANTPQGQGVTFFVNGDYTGSYQNDGSNNGVVVLSTEWKGDNALHDTLVIQGDAKGMTGLKVLHRGADTGAQTGTGIKLVDIIDGDSDPGAFVLHPGSDGYRTAGSKNIIATGPYNYSLVQGGKGGDPKDWYLVSVAAGYRPEVGSYMGNRAVAMGLQWHTLHDRHTLGRLDDPRHHGASANDASGDHDTYAWVRAFGSTGHRDTKYFDAKDNTWLLHLGTDVVRFNAGEEGSLRLGVMGMITHSSGTTKTPGMEGRSRQSTDGLSAGLYATWYSREDALTGLYADAWVMGGRFDNEVHGSGLPRETYRAKVWAVSLEAGYGFQIHESQTETGNTRVFLQPQAQIIASSYRAGKQKEAGGTIVSNMNDNVITTRLGARLYGDIVRGVDKDQTRVRPFAEINWWRGESGQTMSFDDVRVHDKLPRSRGELKIGIEASPSPGLTLWGYGGVQSTFNGRYTNSFIGVGLSRSW